MEKACGAGRPARRNVKGRQRYGRCTGTGSGSPEEVFRMMKRKFVALLTAGLMTIGAGCAVFAEDVDFSAVNTVIKGQLTVGTEAGFAPYEYMVGDEVVGIDMDIAAKIAEKLGVELVVKNEAFDGALLEVQQGKVDLVAAGVSVSEERMKVMDSTAGFVCYSRKVLEKMKFDKVKFVGYAFQIEMKYTVTRLGFHIYEVPIIFTDRVLGTSKMSMKIFKEAFFGVFNLRLRNWKKY